MEFLEFSLFHYLVGRARNVYFVEPDAHRVLSGLLDDVGDVAGAVLAVVEVHLGLGGALHRNG